MKVSTLNDLWVNPLRIGNRRRCVGCNQLVLRQRKRTKARHPKYCTYQCMRRFHRKKQYLRNKQKELEVNRLYRLSRKEYWDQKNRRYNELRKQRINWKYSYLETLKV